MTKARRVACWGAPGVLLSPLLVGFAGSDIVVFVITLVVVVLVSRLLCFDFTVNFFFSLFFLCFLVTAVGVIVLLLFCSPVTVAWCYCFWL